MSAKANILIVDDEPSVRFFLGEELSLAGYVVTTADSGERALAVLRAQSIDLVLLDLKMTGMDGLQVMAEIDRQPLSPMIIVLTAHASLDSAITAMRRGGHDYLRKPCRTEELLESIRKGMERRQEVLRQHKILRQIDMHARELVADTVLESRASSTTTPRFLNVRGLLVDRERYIVTYQGEPVHLTDSEYRLLECLVERIDEVVPFNDLAQALHGPDQLEKWEARRALSTHLWNLRRKIGDVAGDAPYIVNAHGRGYRLVGS